VKLLLGGAGRDSNALVGVKGELMVTKGRFQLLKRGLPMLAVLTSPAGLYAQSCAMCYQTAANSGSHFIQALKHGILILLFPALFIGTAIVIVAYRKRNQCAEH
jgi:hypothetical protein